MARRAYAAADKDARRQVILNAAGNLFGAGTGELPSVAQVAVAAGLAKGTVYLYFRTKGEIFAAVLKDGWGEVIGDLERTFGPAEGARADKVATFLTSYVAYVERHPGLLQLDSLGHGVLERNMDTGALLTFKRAFLGRLTEGATILEGALGLPSGRGLQLLMRTHAMTRGLWQSFDHLQHSLNEPPNSLRSGFGSELLEALSEYWRGALAKA